MHPDAEANRRYQEVSTIQPKRLSRRYKAHLRTVIRQNKSEAERQLSALGLTAAALNGKKR